MLYPWFEVWKISSKEDEDNVALILLVHVHGKHSLCQYITLQRGNIVVGTSLGVNWINPETGAVTSFNGTKDGRSVFEDQIINVVFCDSRQWVLMSYLGRINYSLLGRYLVTVIFTGPRKSLFSGN